MFRLPTIASRGIQEATQLEGSYIPLEVPRYVV